MLHQAMMKTSIKYRSVFKLGQRIKVRVDNVLKDESQIDFGYVGDIDEEKNETKTR